MSTLARQPDHAAGRSRRADDGALTEMARSLLRDARRARGAQHQHGAGSARLKRTAHGSRQAPTLQDGDEPMQMDTDLLDASELAAEAARAFRASGAAGSVVRP
jgi:hypothetical protein